MIRFVAVGTRGDCGLVPGSVGPLTCGFDQYIAGTGFAAGGFASLHEALDMISPSGRALAGMLAVFAEFERDILRDRVKAGIAQASKEGRPHGRRRTIPSDPPEGGRRFPQGISKREIARRIGISSASVWQHLCGRK